MNHPDERDRKLLLHKREILKIGGKATEKGFTIVPLKAYFKKGRVKLEIGLARGKKAHDKRESIKRKELERETRQAVRAAARLGLARASSTAAFMACTRLPPSATPCSTMSNPVPWSTEVRTNGRPSVTFTAWPKAASLTGIRPWSW